MTSLDYCRKLARSNAYGEYLCMLALKPASRPRVLALIALDAELRQVAAKVNEEMLAHIRYAWWRENLARKPAPEHPVLQALANSSPYRGEVGRGADLRNESVSYQDSPHPNPPPTREGILLDHMVDEAQFAWPKLADAHTALHEAVISLLDAPEAAKWQRAQNIVAKHGRRSRAWLALRMLFAG